MAIASNVPMAPANDRSLRDYNYIANVALGGLNTLANTAALDLIQPQWQSGQVAPVTGPAGPYPVTERFWANLIVASAGNSTAAATIQHTGALTNGTVDSANFVNIPELANPLVSNANNGAANVQLPPTVKRFIRGQANGGANTGTLSLQLLF